MCSTKETWICETATERDWGQFFGVMFFARLRAWRVCAQEKLGKNVAGPKFKAARLRREIFKMGEKLLFREAMRCLKGRKKRMKRAARMRRREIELPYV